MRPRGCSDINLALTSLQTLDFSRRDDFEDSFVLERESGEPDAEGRLIGESKVTGLPEDMLRQLKSFLSKVKNADPTMLSEKRSRNEILMRIVGSALQMRLAEYPTTAEEDEKALLETELTSRVRMAVEVRLGEKRLLKETLLLTSAESNADGQENEPTSKRQKVSQ